MKPSTVQLEQAAKTLTEIMDYPWEHMPEQGRQTMRENANKVIAALGAEIAQPVEPVAWRYMTNQTHTIFSEVEPPDDAYDDGTLTPLYAAPQEPAGWQLVPIEPDERMGNCGYRAGAASSFAAHRIYKAMLAAAPQPQGEKLWNSGK